MGNLGCSSKYSYSGKKEIPFKMANTTKTIYIRTAQISLTSEQWASDTYKDIILKNGELGYDSTLNKMKFGDGTHKWTELDWVEGKIHIADSSNVGGILSSNEGGNVTVNSLGVATISLFSSTNKGLVPAATEASEKFLKGNGDWVNPGTGLMTGYAPETSSPVYSTDTLLQAIAKLEARLIELEDGSYYGFS